MQEVISSNISHVGYDEENKILKIRFKQGGEYHYFGVPKEVHTQLLTAQSLGTYLNRNIKSIYSFTKLLEGVAKHGESNE